MKAKFGIQGFPTSYSNSVAEDQFLGTQTLAQGEIWVSEWGTVPIVGTWTMKEHLGGIPVKVRSFKNFFYLSFQKSYKNKKKVTFFSRYKN